MSRTISGARLTESPSKMVGVDSTEVKQYSCAKHALPKSHLKRAVLLTNPNDQRHLETTLKKLSIGQRRNLVLHKTSRRAFLLRQDRKKREWQRRDESRIAAIKLPVIELKEAKKMAGSRTMYRFRGSEARPEMSATEKRPLLPMMKVRRGRREIVNHRNRTFITKLPAIIEVDKDEFQHYSNYCQRKWLNKGIPLQDPRFFTLQSVLHPANPCTSHDPAEKFPSIY